MNSIDFLREKGLLSDEATKFEISFPDGRYFELTELLDDYLSGGIKEMEQAGLLPD
jgi:hypothetical protein